MRLNKIIIASNNRHKVEEIKNILKDYNIEILSLKDAGIELEVEENGKTFEENAYIKAKAVVDLTGIAAIGDDSGLEVEALNGAPGIYSARFAGEQGNYKKNNEKLLHLMKDVPLEKRGARFVTVIALLTPEGDKIFARGEIKGIIGFEEKGCNGFGYDPLFIVPELNKTFAQLSSEEKNKISHRARALHDLKEKLQLKG
ncbi:XTP/dITP diphosphatase [Caloramator sp. E03]|uniref:XTP/dITP diphosphatase n=1 Tax=Caloramator sp. E03 TaxID=2576307 RepID=UPI00111024E2|nr:XTP/dITP diphosphatase [Caloramator sp. E03]QCX33083.1 XTP/dITP diphosphatase [Caloramator sp. E03]